MAELNEDDFFPPEEAERRRDILLRAGLGIQPRNDEERAILADIRQRNGWVE